MTPSPALVPWIIVGLALVDATLSGFRAAAGTDGRIRKGAFYRRAMARGFERGVVLCSALGALTLAVAARPGGGAVYADLVAIGARMLPVFAIFGLLVGVALAVYASSRHEVRTLATVAILGPFTLARPAVIALAALLGIRGARSTLAVAGTLLSCALLLLLERSLLRTFAREAETARRLGAPPEPEPAEATDDGDADADAVHEVPSSLGGLRSPRPAERGPTPTIDDAIDLHHFAPQDIPSVVDEYLREAAAKGLREVRIIHGRGKGVQRARVQKLLSRHDLVQSFRSDGTGSTLAVVRPARRDR